jgi:hypothetical protein
MSRHKFITSTESVINWDEVILSCQNSPNPDRNSVSTVMERVDDNIESGELFKDADIQVKQEDVTGLTQSYYDLISIWEKANYRLSDIEWYDYYPGQHFDYSVQQKFEELVGAKPLRVFVSEVRPGKMVPYHWDIEDFEVEWVKLGEMVRYVCFMQEQEPGHLLFLDEEIMYGLPKNSIYQWRSRKNWHAGVNCGFKPYYLFHYLGYKP